MQVPTVGRTGGVKPMNNAKSRATEAVIERQPSRRQSKKKIELVPKLEASSKLQRVLRKVGINLNQGKPPQNLCGYTQVCKFVGNNWQVTNPQQTSGNYNGGGDKFNNDGGDDAGGNNNNMNTQDLLLLMFVAIVMGRICWCYRTFQNNSLLQYSSIVFVAKNTPKEHLSGLEWMLVPSDEKEPPILRKL
eukprot:TRINITY_DN10012_c0_g2_i1.p2 TRINITY_DN10012_c0_g2~~TRINITY_DN10012_c0_g2_i1.p2  ORF type:complete len:190 (-),score=26.10 TRINITY_DN10012_c0_g2_i1:659-1228(-)